MDTPIDISSSDSENEAEVGPIFPPSTTFNFRALPSWAETSNSRSPVKSSQKQVFPSTKFSVNSNSNGWHPIERGKMQVEHEASFDTGLPERYQYDPRTSHYAGPAEFRASLETGGDSLILLENDDEVMIYESNTAKRVLPTSMMHGKSTGFAQPVVSSDATYHPPTGEERPMESDERHIFQAALQDLSQPKLEASVPDGLLVVPLLRHQKIALHWMLQKETATLHCSGGILADDQGLGKTISMIALIQMQRPLQAKSTADDFTRLSTEALDLDEDDGTVADVEKLNQVGTSDDSTIILKKSTSVPALRTGRPAAGTLVVCPASVLRQWARELDDKVSKSFKLSVLVYHGSGRTKDPEQLAKYDVVLTTYSIVANEVPKQPLADEDDEEQKNSEKYGISAEFNKKRKKNSDAGKKGKKNRKGVDGSAYDNNSGPLARVAWFRVVLDEAQTIKNHRTQVARACCGLRAKRRWCLSGTPIQNAIDDLYSYFRFLRYDPYSVYKSFYLSLKAPISRNAAYGYKKLQAVLKNIMLRRTKGTLIDGEPIIQLPPKSVFLKKVDFSAEERSFYSKLEADSRSQFKIIFHLNSIISKWASPGAMEKLFARVMVARAYAAAGTVNQNYANILLMLLRLRQACDHPLLVKGFHSDTVGKYSLEMARKLPREMQINLLNLLEGSLAICGVCSDPPEDAVVTICGHVFCYQCASLYLTGDDNVCPAMGCKEQLGTDVVFSAATLRSSISDEHDCHDPSYTRVKDEFSLGHSIGTSSKIKATLEILQSLGKSKHPSSSVSSIGSGFSPDSSNHHMSEGFFTDLLCEIDTCMDSKVQSELPEKAIVFSQWTGMLDLLETSLSNSCIQYRRLDGTMSLAARDRAVKDFTNDPEVTVMIMSLKAGNLGLNMVAACHVILLDLWWNPTTEDQAVDRAHRIGQTRPVNVSRLTIKDTVEDRILALQEEKRKMVSSAFGEDQNGSFTTRLTVEDLRYLFMV
ncbi:hypothetical protein ACLOJK_017075 [Asimina triloba]